MNLKTESNRTKNLGNDDGILPCYSSEVSYKQLYYYKKTYNKKHNKSYLVVLHPTANGVVPEGEARKEFDPKQGQERKCRLPSANVIAVYEITKTNKLGKKLSDKIVTWSSHDKMFPYVVGARVTPRYPFVPSVNATCTSGIHVFRTVTEALNY